MMAWTGASRFNRSETFLSVVVLALFVIGVWKSFTYGGEDFKVFYHAARLVVEGRGLEIYTDSPDRYLYAPGFAWLLSPLGVLPYFIALSIWTLLKSAAFLKMIQVLSRRFSLTAVLSGVLLFLRPLLIELRYGQVNLLIVCMAVIAIDAFLDEKSSTRRVAWSWGLFTAAAVAKLFPALLLSLPFFPKRIDQRRRYVEVGAVMGVGTLILVLPVVSEGFSGALHLVLLWRDALLAKGFPTETHNQSFMAFLYHVFSGEGVYSLMRGPELVNYGGWIVLPKFWIYALGKTWAILTFTGVMASCALVSLDRKFKFVPIAIALCVLPSHLVWKPYFVLMIPLAAYAFHLALGRKSRFQLGVLVLAAVLVNFTSFDFIGRVVAANFEAYATPLWVSLGLMGYCYKKSV